MTGKNSIFRFIRTIVLATLGTGLFFGIVGFLLSGQDGFANMATLGFVIGLFGSLVLAFALFLDKKYWGSNWDSTRINGLGEWDWFIRKSNDSDEKDK